jgi:hypothetical protein
MACISRLRRLCTLVVVLIGLEPVSIVVGGEGGAEPAATSSISSSSSYSSCDSSFSSE